MSFFGGAAPLLLVTSSLVPSPGAQPSSVEAAEDASPDAVPPLDVAAYFADGPFASAQRLVERGETRAAVGFLKRMLKERPDAPERPQARYLLGLSLIQLGEYEEAARLFDELAVTYPLLRDDHLFFRGQALYLWGSFLQAAEALAGIDPEGPRGDEARRLRAWALLKATDFERVARWLEGLEKKEGRLDPELLFVLARARHRTGDVLGAYRAFRDVWREDPAGKLAGPALAEIAELRIGDKPMLTEAEQSAVRALEPRLASGRDPDGAMGELERRLERSPDSHRLRAEIAYARGRIAQAKGRLGSADAHYARALGLAPVEMVELRARVGLEQGRVERLLGQDARALAAFQRVAERFPERREAEDALFHSAEIQLSERKYKEAQAEFERLLLKNPVTEYRPRCLWGIGWAHFRLAQYERAHQFFGSLARMNLPADVGAASNYWLGRTHATLGRTEEARAAFRSVIENHPLSHYAALAEDQLAETIVTPAKDPKVESGKSIDLSLETSKELIQVREYARLGLRGRARGALSELEAAERKPGKLPSEQRLHAIARLYDELGQNADARRVREECAREFPRSLGDKEFEALARKTHPLKFEQPIRESADEFAISDALLFGLVRTESGFRPDAVSNMSAYGLAQLLLPTARAVASELRVGRVTKVRLLRDPVLNVRLGAAYFRSLLDRYDGSEPLALAAYNAGPSAVDAWLAHRVRPLEGVGDAGKGVGLLPAPDELTEEIPVAETRAFVKTVLARARGYARLYPRARETEVLESPRVEAGAFQEPRDLPSPMAEILDLPRGSRAAFDSWTSMEGAIAGGPGISP